MENTDREFAHFSESDSITVKDFLCSTPWSESLHIAHDVSHMRQPTMAFERATVFRGTFEPLKVRYRQTTGVLFLWRKKDATKLYIQSHPFDDLSKLVESNWSCVPFWNSDGRVPSKPATTLVTPDIMDAPPAPPPGLDPDEYMTPTGPDMLGDIPGDPFTPGDSHTPGDSPDSPFTPHPGQRPPDNQAPDNPFPPFPGPQPPSQSPPAISAPPIPASFLLFTPVQPD